MFSGKANIKNREESSSLKIHVRFRAFSSVFRLAKDYLEGLPASAFAPAGTVRDGKGKTSSSLQLTIVKRRRKINKNEKLQLGGFLFESFFLSIKSRWKFMKCN